MRQKNDFGWPDSTEDPSWLENLEQDYPDTTTSGPTGASLPEYEFNEKQDSHFARRSYKSDGVFPWWFYAGIGALLVLFVIIGIALFSGNDENGGETTPTVSALDQNVATTLANMTTEEKVAQLFFLTPEALTGVDVVTAAGDATLSALSQYPIGGIAYSSQNIESEDQLKTMIANSQSYSKYPLFIGVTEEGGSGASSIANSGLITVEAVNDASTIGATNDDANAYAAGHVIGGYLANLGFNVDFAPVADVATTADNLLGTRTFGSDPNIVAAMVQKEIAGIEGQGVSTTLTHFPGLGNTATDTQTTLATSEKTLEELQSSEFVPFKAGIDAGADFVMVSYIALPNVTGDNTPALFSSQIINDILRGTLGFNGIVVSDAMNTTAITSAYSSGDAAVAFIQAGGDMILMPANFTEAYNAVLAAVQNGTISEERLNESVTRILKVKLA